MYRLNKAHGVPYFITVNKFIANKNYGHVLLQKTLFAFLEGNRFFVQFYDPLTHNHPAIKRFIMDFVRAYRNPYFIKVGKGKGKKNLYVPKSDVPNLPEDITVQSKKKKNSISKENLGVGMLCWHSISNLNQPGMRVVLLGP